MTTAAPSSSHPDPGARPHSALDHGQHGCAMAHASFNPSMSSALQHLEASRKLPKHLQNPHLGCGRLAGTFVVSGVFLCGRTVAGLCMCQDCGRTSAASDKGGGRPRLCLSRLRIPEHRLQQRCVKLAPGRSSRLNAATQAKLPSISASFGPAATSSSQIL